MLLGINLCRIATAAACCMPHTQSMLRLAATSLTVCIANMAESNAIKMQSRPPTLRGCKDAAPKQTQNVNSNANGLAIGKARCEGEREEWKKYIPLSLSPSLSRSLLVFSQMVAPNIQIALRDDAQMICCLHSRKAFLSLSPIPLSTPVSRLLSLLSFVQ